MMKLGKLSVQSIGLLVLTATTVILFLLPTLTNGDSRNSDRGAIDRSGRLSNLVDVQCDRLFSYSKISLPPSCGPVVKILQPNGGEEYYAGEDIVFKWIAKRAEECVFSLWKDEHAMTQIYTFIPKGEGSYTLRYPKGGVIRDLKRKAHVQCWTNDRSAKQNVLTISDVSDGYFTIHPAIGSVTEISPLAVPNNVLVDNTIWGRFSITVEEEGVLFNPTTFTITTTGMQHVSKLNGFKITWEPGGGTIISPRDIPLINGIATVFLEDPISDLAPGYPNIYQITASIPSEERFKVQQGATITITAKPASHWTATGERSGVRLPLDSFQELNMGTVNIVGIAGGGAGGGGTSQ